MMEKIKLEHICPYIPYGLKGNFEVSEVVPEAKYELREKLLTTDNLDFFLKYATPILYPISCLTKTIQHGNESFVPLVKLAKMCWDGLSGYELHPTRLEIITRFSSMMYENAQYKTLTFREGSFCFSVLDSELKIIGHFTASNQYQLFQKLAEWHINFVGIPEGLYIDKNTLK